MSDSDVGSENVQTSSQLKRKLSVLEEEESNEQQISKAERQRAKLFGHYRQQSKIRGQRKRKLSVMGEEEKKFYKQHISKAGHQRAELFGHYGQQSETHGQLKRKLSGIGEEEKKSYKQHISKAGHQRVDQFEDFGQQLKDYIVPEKVKKHSRMDKTEKKLRAKIRIFQRKYINIQKEINVMQNGLKEMDLI